MKYVYLLKNNITKSYSDPIFRFEGFDDMARQHHNFMILYPDKAKEQFLHVSTLVVIGNYDDETGTLYLFPEGERKSYNLQESWEQLKALEATRNA